MIDDTVRLSSTEIMQAAFAGVMRQVQNMRDRRNNAHGLPRERDWQVHIEGALAECAVAKALGLYWPGVGEIRGYDVGNLDVRSTPRPNGHLILYPGDSDDRPVILIVGQDADWRIAGWIMARDGKLSQYWTTHTRQGKPCDASEPGATPLRAPCYFVPQSALQPIESLRQEEQG